MARLRRIGGDLARLETCQDATRPRATAKKKTTKAKSRGKRFRLHRQPWSSPRRRANQQRSEPSEVSSRRSARPPLLFTGSRLITSCGSGKNLRLCLSARKNKFSHEPPFVWTLPLQGPSGRSAARNYYFWTRLLLFLFCFSLLRLLPGDGRGRS